MSSTPLIRRDSSGAALKVKALETRADLLECLKNMLDNTPFHHVKVVDVARIVGVSPATFYQNFASIDDAMAALMPLKWSDPDNASLWEIQVQNWATVQFHLQIPPFD